MATVEVVDGLEGFLKDYEEVCRKWGRHVVVRGEDDTPGVGVAFPWNVSAHIAWLRKHGDHF
jgi:hypothetical protein